MLPRWLITFRAFALASAFAAAFVPIATYITDDKRDWLWIHIGVNIAAYIAVALTTIYTTVNLTQQDHNKFSVPAYWANNVIMRTWYLGVSKTWRWHVAAAVGRLGLALALAQHVHTTKSWLDGEFQGILSPFQYWSYNGWSDLLKVRTQGEVALTAFTVLVGFAVLDGGILSGFTILSKNLTLISSKPINAAIMRVALCVFLVTTMAFLQKQLYNGYTLGSEGYSYYTYDKTLDYRYPLKEWHKVAFTWLDNGTMLAAWMMRPTGYGDHGCVVNPWSDSGLPPCLWHENRHYVFVDIVAALAAYATYFLAIIASLQLAQYLHWRREQRESPTPAPTTP